jgi:hypothetical protein
MKIRTALAAVAATALITTLGTTAASADANYLTAQISRTCDTSVGEWVIDWQITNPTSTDTTLTDVRSSPTATPIVDLPTSVPAGTTVHAGQRVAGTASAGLQFIAAWADGSTYSMALFVRPLPPCVAV